MVSGELTVLVLPQRATALLSVLQAWLLVRLHAAKCVLWCWQSVPQTCSSFCTESSCGPYIAKGVAGPGHISRVAVTALAGSRSHWASASSLVLSFGAWAANREWHLSALRCACDAHIQLAVQARMLPQAHASSGIHHLLQALSGCSCQASACCVPQGTAGLLVDPGITCPGTHAPALHMSLVGAMLRTNVCSAAERQSRTCTTFWAPSTLQSSL